MVPVVAEEWEPEEGEVQEAEGNVTKEKVVDGKEPEEVGAVGGKEKEEPFDVFLQGLTRPGVKKLGYEALTMKKVFPDDVKGLKYAAGLTKDQMIELTKRSDETGIVPSVLAEKLFPKKGKTTKKTKANQTNGIL